MANVYRANKKSGGVTPTGTKQITISAAGTTTHDVANYANAEITTDGLVKPTGTKTITQNGTGIDVANYKYADVNVPSTSLEFIDDIVPSGNAGGSTKSLNVGSLDYKYLYIKSGDSYAMVELINNTTVSFGFGDTNLNFRCGQVESVGNHQCTIRYTTGYRLRDSSSGTWSADTSKWVPRAVYGSN